MIRRLRRMFLGKKKKHYNKNRPSWKDFQDLENRYWKLSNQMDDLAKSLDRQMIGDTYVTTKDAKKYNKFNSIF